MNFVLTRDGSEHAHRGTYAYIASIVQCMYTQMVLKCLPLKDRGDYTYTQTIKTMLDTVMAVFYLSRALMYSIRTHAGIRQ